MDQPAPSRRRWLVTGASSGIGAAFARRLAADGHDLVVTARRRDRLEALAADLAASHGADVLCVCADLAEPAGASGLLSALGTREIDGLINNAGFGLAGTFAATAWAEQARFIQLCCTAPAELAHGLAPPMAARGWGRIIQVASLVAFSPGAAGYTLYPAAKAFVLKMSRSLAAELSDAGVQVTALCPGATRSEFLAASGTPDANNGLPQMSAEAVVDAALRGCEAGREVVVPGLFNSAAATLMTALPDGLVTPLVRGAVERGRHRKEIP
jgi:uncharacterized protein